MSGDISETHTLGRITEEGIARARRMIGVHLRAEGPYLQDVTSDSIRTFSNGVGDLNPLYRDSEYGRTSRHGSIIGHPLLPLACAWVGRARWGLPGVHSFLGGHDWEFFRHVRPSDRLTVIERVMDVEQKASEFSGTLVIQRSEAEFANQHDEIVCRVGGWSTRHERSASRERGKYRAEEPFVYSDEDMQRIDAAMTGESATIRGSGHRYWEDVEVGEQLNPVVRGPLAATDTIGFLVACGRGQTHGLAAGAAARHPGHFTKAVGEKRAENTMNVHHRASVAKDAGMPGAFDFGAQRLAWMVSLVTNWMGDAGVLKRFRAELRRPNVLGDTTWCKGRVKQKFIIDHHPMVEVELWAENQHGEVTVSSGVAILVLPSRDPTSRICRNGAAIDLRATPIPGQSVVKDSAT